jgi:fatty-acyl-CoA synthase
MTLEGLCEDGHKLSKEILAAAKSQVCASDSDMILFTSGTSGSPKGVITTHYSRVNNVRAQALVLDATYTDKFLIVLPMFHCFSLSASILAAMAVGACVCFPENRRTKTILKTIEENKCTILTAVPTLFSAILARNDIKDYDLSTLRTGLIGGSTYPPSLFRKICNELGFELLPSLGQTEATAGITAGRFSDSMEVKSQTVGRFLEHIEGSIKDMDGNLLSQGQQGEICIRGYNVMQGYYKRPDLTKMVIDNDGWLHTGDIGYIDDQLNIHLTGRIKDMIIRGGENIAPSEIEDVIADLPGIRQVKVVGVPDDHYIEEICACIVCTDDSKVTPDEIRQYLKGFLAYYKIPKHIVFIDSLPMNQNNKVDINKCKDKALQILSAQRK